MIHLYRASLGLELLAPLNRSGGTVADLEAAFALAFEADHAVAFRYGRSGLWALLRALGIQEGEVILPAYTCAVLAHAIVLSGNAPRFVDVTLRDHNLDLDQLPEAITPRTQAIIAVHTFGHPLNVDRLQEIVSAAEGRLGRKLWVIHDCAHAVGARWRGRMVCNAGDAAFFSLHHTKIMTAYFGGMVTTRHGDLWRKVGAVRQAKGVQRGPVRAGLRYLSFWAAAARQHDGVYRLAAELKRAFPWLARLRAKYHLADPIAMPPDYLDAMTDGEARIGLRQLERYPELVAQRQEGARDYARLLRGIPGLILPPLVDGATYSHYAVRHENPKVIGRLRQNRSIELRPWLTYSLPETPAYQPYAEGQSFPNARTCSTDTIILPIHAGITHSQRRRVAGAIAAAVAAEDGQTSE